MSKSKYIVNEVNFVEEVASTFLMKCQKLVKNTPLDKEFILFITDYEKQFRVEAVKQWKKLVHKIKISNYIYSEVAFFTAIYDSEFNKVFWFYRYYSTEYRHANTIKKKNQIIKNLKAQKFLLGYKNSLEVISEIQFFNVYGDDLFNIDSQISPQKRQFIYAIAYLEYVSESLSIQGVTIPNLIEFLQSNIELKKLKIKIPESGAKFYTDYKSRNNNDWSKIKYQSIKNNANTFGKLAYYQESLYEFLSSKKDFIRYDLSKSLPVFAFRANIKKKNKTHAKKENIKIIEVI